jgi:pimeloyl-ACP methyl ester carboxylesterase
MTPAKRNKSTLQFEPDDAGFNRTNALYLAHAADIAYHRSPADAALERLGLKAIAFRSKLTRARGFLGVCKTHAVLSFRGTDPVTFPNWLTVVAVRLVECGEYTGRVHHGFNYALGRTWSKVEAILDEVEGKPLFLTGHSMGGALAVLAACRLAKAGRPAAATYTFGAPRVGDHHFCSGYDLPTYRLVNRLDLVPELPLEVAKMESAAMASPKAPLLKGRTPVREATSKTVQRKPRGAAAYLPCYRHVNTLVYLDRDGEITLDADVTPWHVDALARALATRGKSFFEGISDHLIANYIRGLEGTADASITGVRRRLRTEGRQS